MEPVLGKSLSQRVSTEGTLSDRTVHCLRVYYGYQRNDKPWFLNRGGSQDSQ
jgi:hypothetical protein